MDDFLLLYDDIDQIPIRETRVLWERKNPFIHFNDAEFRRNFRLEKQTLLSLVDILRVDLERPNNRGSPLSPEQQVCLCLQYLATGIYGIYFLWGEE